MASGDVETLEELNDVFHTWITAFYHTRRHGSTGVSPEERAALTNRKPRRVPEAELNEVFYWQEERKVDKTGCVSLQGSQFEVASELVGAKVQLRYDPFDLSVIQVWRDDQRWDDARTIDLTRRHDRRVQPESSVQGETDPGVSIFDALKERKRQASEGLQFSAVKDGEPQ
ncbi:Mu transposase C-terminal domain-containing protein [Alicyclobacillus acidoterrestris]|uniref:Mu transposase C-terminal domain-containing protein n=1 Tax=Alicyclobacillus acidoterrestris (strain ATCC 49025 / DSM 3922 / CIP 106132 / NCIMB 13137 / GD3B) TaxID=1356854 RepID=A0A9E6ZUJ7_ALIAG|nr:Mu transposase C-terminal domain-containing protein [Alicyclobacillus acidoterrestris]UNO49444.1 Mu transposase C-terminal domain-containing protein [Alicyclobacillus acidoterrestris]